MNAFETYNKGFSHNLDMANPNPATF